MYIRIARTYILIAETLWTIIILLSLTGCSYSHKHDQPPPKATTTASTENFQSGFLDSKSSSLDLATIVTQNNERLKPIRLGATPNSRARQSSRRANTNAVLSGNLSSGVADNNDQATSDQNKRTDSRRVEVLTTDCVSKRNEILNRLQQGHHQSKPAILSSDLVPEFTGFQKLSPKHGTSETSMQNNQTTYPMFAIGDGEHLPKCNQQGGFEPIQCHRIGYCWCVNKYGQAIKNSASPAGIEPICDPNLYESESNDLLVVAGISAHRIKNLLKSSSPSSTGTTMSYRESDPDSTSDGSVQSSSDSSEAISGEPTLPLVPNDCRLSQSNAKDRALKFVNDSIWVPDCDNKNDNLYAERQCHKSKVCWCVDQTTGLPLKFNEQMTSPASSNCSEIRKSISLTTSITKQSIAKQQTSFFNKQTEFCDSDKKIEFLIALNDQFRRHISEFLRQNPTVGPPIGVGSSDPFKLTESQVSRWKFAIMDRNSDGTLGDREWSKFKNNFKLVDKFDDAKQASKMKPSLSSTGQLVVPRSQRRCWREFLEFCGNGGLLDVDSVSLAKWQTCTDLPPKTVRDDMEQRGSMTIFENTYAHSREAAIIRSKKKNPFLGILKPD